MSELENAKTIVQALINQKTASDALGQLARKDIIINRSSLAAQANVLIDARDAAQRKVEETLGSVSAETRKTVLDTYISANPNDKYGKSIADYVKKVDGK